MHPPIGNRNMSTVNQEHQPLIDRRQKSSDRPDVLERRQFRDSRDASRPETRELADAIDTYKMTNRRRFITVDELLDVIISLGYSK